jgi:hypothetical protein
MKLHLQKIAGRPVHDVDGNIVGRIHCVHAELVNGECIIKEWHVGPAALLERLGLSAGRLIGIGGKGPLRIPWEKIDVSDPKNLRLTCREDELPPR